jgi:hypothetical protein
VNASFCIEDPQHWMNAIYPQRAEKLSNNWVLDSGSAPCHTSCTMQQFLENNQIPTIPQALYASDHVTYSGSQDSRLESEVFILHLYKKISRMQLQVHNSTNTKLSEVLRAIAGPLEQVCKCGQAVL